MILMFNQNNYKVIGLDLDLTLVDSTKAIVFAATSALGACGYKSNSKKLESMIGIPIKKIFGTIAARDDIELLFDRYQEIYAEQAFKLSKPMPGAVNFLNYLNSEKYISVVITAKTKRLASLQLEFLNMRVSKIVGDSFQAGKTEALIQNNCQIYLGDHLEDYNSAKNADIPFIGIGKGWMHPRGDHRGTFLSVSSLEELNTLLLPELR
jgi:phosphoglycolate phosphatase-like HAD superfamily hydrolase